MSNWKARDREGSAQRCPSCQSLVPASLIHLIRDKKVKCPVCHNWGTDRSCPWCLTLLVSSYAGLDNPHERWHCPRCDSRFNDLYETIK
jgi:uncharacterized paraquat-inducible protein A